MKNFRIKIDIISSWKWQKVVPSEKLMEKVPVNQKLGLCSPDKCLIKFIRAQTPKTYFFGRETK
jgi:hypothetical protein